MIWSGWEEGGGTGDADGTPLLDKTVKAAVQRQSTVAMLLSCSAQDTPLLLVAFVAGVSGRPEMPDIILRLLNSHKTMLVQRTAIKVMCCYM